LNSYELSRAWFDWSFENPSKITPAHGILYFFCIEHCNRLGWKKEFGLPTTMAKEAIGIRSYNTYINTLNDLVEWGFIKLIEKSKNQYSSNIIALSNFDNASDKALDKALIKHATKQRESTSKSNSSIDKQLTIEQETIELHLLQTFIKEKLPNVSKMKRQLTFEEAEKLFNNFPQQLVKDKLLAMENKATLTKDYSSVYLTVNAWCKNEPPKIPLQYPINLKQ